MTKPSPNERLHMTTDANATRPSGHGRFYAAVVAGVAVVAVIVAALLLFTSLGGAPSPEPGEPQEVSVQDLRAFASSSDGPVYWAGAVPGRTLELTKTNRNHTYVRYLGAGAQPGDRRAIFTTVATYPRQRSYQEATRAAKLKGAKSRPAPGGGLAVWRDSRPTSVYLAYPGQDALVEVFDPSPQRASKLALSGDIGPVR